MSADQILTCAKCGHVAPVAIVSKIMDSQRIVWSLTPKPGYLLSVETIGGSLTALAELLGAIGSNHGVKTSVLVENIECQDGAVTVHLLMTSAVQGLQPEIPRAER